MKLTIDRAKWLHGEGTQYLNSYLLRGADNKMCCLGFLGKKCGIHTDVLLNQHTPLDLHPVNRAKYPKFTHTSVQNIYGELMLLNDGDLITHRVRERKIKRLMKSLGVYVTFVGRRKAGT